MLATHSVPSSPKRVFMSKENRLYPIQDGPAQATANKRLRSNSGNGRYKSVEPDMFVSSAWSEGRENTRSPRPSPKAPLIRSTPHSLWQITPTPKENTDPRVEISPVKKCGSALDPIGSERRQFASNASVLRTANATPDFKPPRLPVDSPNRESFTWAGAGPESNMDLLTSPLSLMSPGQGQEDIVKPMVLVTRPLRPAVGPHRHSFHKAPSFLLSSYSPNSNHHSSNSLPSFSSSYTYPAYLSLPNAGGTIDSESAEYPPMTITQFASVLREIRRKNPHAPKMPSMLNPLRASAPFMYYHGVEPNTRNPYSNLTWNFQKRRVVVNRSRSICAVSNKNLRPVVYVCNGDTHHCIMCKRENLLKRLLISRYWRRQNQAEARARLARLEMELERQRRVIAMGYGQSVPRDVGESESEFESGDESEGEDSEDEGTDGEEFEVEVSDAVVDDIAVADADVDGDVRMEGALGLELGLRNIKSNGNSKSSSKRNITNHARAHMHDVDMDIDDVLDITGARSLVQDLKHYARAFDVGNGVNANAAVDCTRVRDRVEGTDGGEAVESDLHRSFLLSVPGVPDRRGDANGDASFNVKRGMDIQTEMDAGVGDWVPDSPVLKDMDSFPDVDHDGELLCDLL
ncbi:hypothetical protein D9758_003851 [Tetrapyrgos nigripes]|uniref:Uncharacterized protein n=1 Tax=Tetrapyrgos nigripes TaxID=182062 RepID=A0A8H5GLS3_9AGAR|nr:hypothetical protein D9758_003851 [Tetrapyrgos nigripes]